MEYAKGRLVIILCTNFCHKFVGIILHKGSRYSNRTGRIHEGYVLEFSLIVKSHILQLIATSSHMLY